MTLSKLEQTKRQVEKFAREVARDDSLKLWEAGVEPNDDLVVEAVVEHGWCEGRQEEAWAVAAYRAERVKMAAAS